MSSVRRASKLPVYSVQFAERNGKTWLLTAGADKTARVWDVDGDLPQPKLVGKVLEGHYAAVRQAVFSRDASLIVTVGDDNRAVVWELRDDEFKWTRIPFDGHQSAIRAAAIFSSTDKPRDIQVATADEDGHMIVWAPLLLPPKNQTKAGQSALTQTVRATDATLGSIPKTEATDAALLSKGLEEHDKAVNTLAFSGDGKFLLSGSDDNTVKLQRIVKRSNQLKSDSDNVQTFRGHGGWVRACAFGSFTSNLQPAESAGADRNEVIDGFVVSGSHDGTVMRWNVSMYREERVFRDPILAGTTAPDRDVLSAVFSPDGKTVLTGGRDHKGSLWNIDTGAQRNFSFAPAKPTLIEEGHDLPIWTAAYAPRGDWLVTAGMDGQSVLWNTTTGTQFAKINGTGLPAVVAVSPDGQWIATSYTKPRASTLNRGADEKSEKIRFWNVTKLNNSGSEPAQRAESAACRKAGI